MLSMHRWRAIFWAMVIRVALAYGGASAYVIKTVCRCESDINAGAGHV